MKRYGKYIRPYWYAFILGPLLMLTEVAGEVLLPSFMADIINVGAANHDVGYILQKGMIMILTAFIMMAGGGRRTRKCGAVRADSMGAWTVCQSAGGQKTACKDEPGRNALWGFSCCTAALDHCGCKWGDNAGMHEGRAAGL